MRNWLIIITCDCLGWGEIEFESSLKDAEEEEMINGVKLNECLLFLQCEIRRFLFVWFNWKIIDWKYEEWIDDVIVVAERLAGWRRQSS